MYGLLCQFLPLYSQLWLLKSSQQIAQLCLIPESLRRRPGGVLEANSPPAGIRKLVCSRCQVSLFSPGLHQQQTELAFSNLSPCTMLFHFILLSWLPFWAPWNKPQAQDQLSRTLSLPLAPADHFLQGLIDLISSIISHWLLHCLNPTGIPDSMAHFPCLLPGIKQISHLASLVSFPFNQTLWTPGPNLEGSLCYFGSSHLDFSLSF